MRLTTFRVCHQMGEEPPLPRGNHELRTAMLEHGSSTPYRFGPGACSLLHLSLLTRFISDSHLFSIPSFLAPYRVEAPRVDLPSRFSLHRQTPVGLRCHPGFPPHIAISYDAGRIRKHMAVHMVESKNSSFYSNTSDFVSHLTPRITGLWGRP